MTPEEFVEVQREVVYESACKGVMKTLKSPPGQSPPETLRQAADWFSQLDATGQACVDFVARSAAQAAVFGLLAVLDGVRAFDASPDATLRLLHVDANGEERLLNPVGVDLHDLFNAVVHPAHEPLNQE